MIEWLTNKVWSFFWLIVTICIVAALLQGCEPAQSAFTWCKVEFQKADAGTRTIVIVVAVLLIFGMYAFETLRSRVMGIRCIKCQHMNKRGAKYCANCGSDVTLVDDDDFEDD